MTDDIDYKHGADVPIEDNPQLSAYGLGALLSTDDRGHARGLIHAARKVTKNPDCGYGLRLLIETLTNALETEIGVSDALRKTVKAYLAADKFRD